MKSISRHGNVLAIAGCGILIEGFSGSGKSSLTMGLIERAESQGLDAALVTDDRVVLTETKGTLVASVPDSIVGKIELRGYGIVDLPHKASTELSLAVRMRADEEIKRMPEKSFVQIGNVKLPLLEVPMRHEAAATRIVFAWLKDNMGIGLENSNLHQVNSLDSSSANR